MYVQKHITENCFGPSSLSGLGPVAHDRSFQIPQQTAKVAERMPQPVFVFLFSHL